MYEMAKKENTQSCFQRGLISLLILALLDQEDMYANCTRAHEPREVP